MISFIKGPYISPTTGVTNIETAWKVTADKDGFNVLDITQLSPDTVDHYYSNILVPKNEEVYIWYQMKLSNDEIKDWSGPYPYQSRDSNVSSDLKPLIRVETPYTTIDEDTLKSGTNLIKVNSSVFRGDPIDGILSTTWMVKNPKNEIILFKPQDKIRVDDIDLNRATLGLSKYEYIDVYIKHHSANGAASDFGVNRYSLKIYPFKVSADTIVESTRDFSFTVIPYDSNNVGLKNIRVVDAITGAKVHEINDVSNLVFTVPAYTLSDDKEYIIECYTINTGSTTYPLKLDTYIVTEKLPTIVEYDDTVIYDLNSITPKGFTSTFCKGEYTLVNDIAYVLNLDYSISRYTVDKPNEAFTIDTMLVDDAVTPYISNDSKLLNLRSGRLLLVSRISSIVYILNLVVIGNKIVLDINKNIVSYPCKDITQNLTNTVTLSLDGLNVYMSIMDSTYVNFLRYNIVNNIITQLTTRDKITYLNYKPSSMLLIANGLDTIFSIGGNDEDDIYYEYNIKTAQWIARGVVDANDISSFIPDAILLQNRTVLFTNNDSDGLYIISVDNLSKLHTVPSTVPLDGYRLSFIDDVGTLYMLDYSNSRLFTIKSQKQ